MDEAQLKETVDAIVEHDLVSYGYKYFNLDDCWSKGRHPNGTQYADPAHFPSVCGLILYPWVTSGCHNNQVGRVD